MKCEATYVGGYRAGQPCPYRASEVIATIAYTLQVCGHHAKAYPPDVRYPLTYNLRRIRELLLERLDD